MNAVLVVGSLSAIYGLVYLGLALVPLPAFVRAYVAQPVLWISLIIFVRRLPGYRLAGKLNQQTTIIALAVMVGFSQVVVYAIGGLFSRFGQNPASLTPVGIITNLIFAGTMLVGMELSRAWLINSLGRKHTALVLGLVALLCAALSIPLAQFTGFKWEIESVTRVNSAWLPLLAESLLASVLVRFGGARASIAYRGMVAAFWWLSPIIPDLPWALKGISGAAVPIVGMMMVTTFQTETNRGKPRRQAKKASFPTGWIVTAIACVVIIWFAVGLFPVRPSSIASGSMVPVFNIGDVVIVAKVPVNRIKLGDIIEYRRMENNKRVINIMHRVIKVEGSGEGVSFITKGDANNVADADPVPPTNVVGKVIYTIPKIGLISLFMKQPGG